MFMIRGQGGRNRPDDEGRQLMHGGKQSRPRHAGLPAGDGPGAYRDRPGGDPGDDAQHQTYASPVGQRGARPTKPHGFRSRRDRRRQIRAARRTIAGRHPVATAVLDVIVLLMPVWFSLGNALPTWDWALRWRRAALSGSAVTEAAASSNWAENQWYSHHPPPVGGAPARPAIPSLGPASQAQLVASRSHCPEGHTRHTGPGAVLGQHNLPVTTAGTASGSGFLVRLPVPSEA